MRNPILQKCLNSTTPDQSCFLYVVQKDRILVFSYSDLIHIFGKCFFKLCLNAMIQLNTICNGPQQYVASKFILYILYSINEFPMKMQEYMSSYLCFFMGRG